MNLFRKIPDWVFYGSIVLFMLLYANGNNSDVSAPAPPPPELGPLLPSESPRDARILVEVAAPQSGVGTAFASSASGEWITARHVVDSCDEVAVKIGARKLLRIEDTEIIETADLAKLTSGWTRKPLANDLNSQRQINELGYFFGFPQGKPGEVVGSLMSRGRLQVRGRYATDEGVLIWSEQARTAGLKGSLGGLSGGPVLDADGEVIGVVAAETPGRNGRRRGRVYTVSPRSLGQVIGGTDSVPVAIDLQSYPIAADRMRRDRRVAQVVCLNEDS